MERVSRCEEQVLVTVWDAEETPDLSAVMNRVNQQIWPQLEATDSQYVSGETGKERVSGNIQKRTIYILSSESK